jgi:nickel superoxide dismutase
MKKFLSKLLPEATAEAHCDIPCGIYEPTPAKIAAMTVRRMAEQHQEIKPPDNHKDFEALRQFQNMVSRRIAVKEQHAEICKREISILWSDFFKPEHLENMPHLHDLVWKALKLCSKNKQETNTETARQLVDAVDEIAKAFYEAKGTPEKFEAYQKLTDTLY